MYFNHITLGEVQYGDMKYKSRDTQKSFTEYGTPHTATQEKDLGWSQGRRREERKGRHEASQLVWDRLI